MKTTLHRSLVVTAAAALLLSVGSFQAQAQNQPRGKGNFDPAQFAQQRLDAMREQFDVKDDGEWKLISDRITKIQEAARATRSTGGFGRTRTGGGNTDPNAQPQDNGGKRQRGGGGFPQQQASPEADALQKALEAKASPDEIKAKLERLRESRKEAEAKLEKLQADLREVLSVRQEAVAVMYGLLK